ncbi:hypothetical protein Tco_1568991 [Tanacetum coccineum]
MVDVTNIVTPVNVDDEENEITDEVYELKRKVKGKNVEETRISPIPSPTRSPRNLSTLVSSDTEKLQELTVTHPTPSSGSSEPKLTKTNRLLSLIKKRFMPRKSSDQLADNLHNVMMETLPLLVKEKVMEQVKKEVHAQVRDQVPVYLYSNISADTHWFNDIGNAMQKWFERKKGKWRHTYIGLLKTLKEKQLLPDLWYLNEAVECATKLLPFVGKWDTRKRDKGRNARAGMGASGRNVRGGQAYVVRVSKTPRAPNGGLVRSYWNNRYVQYCLIWERKYIERDPVVALLSDRERTVKENSCKNVPVIVTFPEVFPDDVQDYSTSDKLHLELSLCPEATLKGLFAQRSSPWGEPVCSLRRRTGSFRVQGIRKLSYSEIGRHRTTPTEKEKKYEWGSEEEKRSRLEARCYSSPILALLMEQDFVVYRDASHTGYGVSVQRKSGDGLKLLSDYDCEIVTILVRLSLSTPGVEKDGEPIRVRSLVMKVKAETQKPSGLLQLPEIPVEVGEINHGFRVETACLHQDFGIIQEVMGDPTDMEHAYHQRTGWSSEETIQVAGGLVEKRIVQIKNRLLTAKSRQKSYADVRRKPMEFQVGDMVMLKVSPWRGVIRFRKRGKLSPRYMAIQDIIERFGPVLQAELPDSNSVEFIGTFHGSNLKEMPGRLKLLSHLKRSNSTVN